MFDLQGPPTTPRDYQAHVQALSGLLRKVPVDDRLDLLQGALARAVPRWVEIRSPWKPWIILVLRGEIRDYFRASRPGHDPILDDLPSQNVTPQLLSTIELSHLFDHLHPPERRALLARKGGRTAHRALQRLRQLAARGRTT